jgi:hypothetical protein
MLYKGDMKWRCAILTLVSIYRMGDTPTFMIKRDTHAFVIRDGMGDAPTFVIKGGTPLETRVFFTCIIRDVQ